MQSDPYQVINIKEKDGQIHLNGHKKNRWQAELAAFPKMMATLLPKLNLAEYIFNYIIDNKTFVSEILQYI